MIAVTYVSSIYKHQIGEKHHGTLWAHSIPAPWFARENSAASVAVRRDSPCRAAMYATPPPPCTPRRHCWLMMMMVIFKVLAGSIWAPALQSGRVFKTISPFRILRIKYRFLSNAQRSCVSLLPFFLHVIFFNFGNLEKNHPESVLGLMPKTDRNITTSLFN